MIRRRLCTSKSHKGTRWLPVVYFYVKEWGDKEGTWVAQYQSWCITCQNVYSRQRKAIREGRDPAATGPKRKMDKSEKARRKAAEFQRRMERVNPETGKTGREELRVVQREAAAARRRERGVPERGAWKRHKVREARKGSVRMPAGPLISYLRDQGWLEVDDRAIQVRLEGNVEIGGWEVERMFTHEQRRLLRQAEAEGGDLSLETVDGILLAIGRPDVFSVLYGEVGVGSEDSVAI